MQSAVNIWLGTACTSPELTQKNGEEDLLMETNLGGTDKPVKTTPVENWQMRFTRLLTKGLVFI